jgi:hypothetical protein
MIDKYPNPWNFNNNDKILFPSDGPYRVVYDNLNEIAMGGPIAGQCFLEAKEQTKIRIHDFCGGPPAWETLGQLLAIPIWARMHSKGTVQQIGVVDTRTSKLTIFKKIFRVLDIHNFDKGIIYGIDSPIYMTTPLRFDIVNEEIDKIIIL